MPSYKYTVLSNTTIGTMMGALDSSIVLIALPTILKKLPGTGADEGLWIIMGYMLITSTFVLNFGRLGDMFGRARTYNFGFAVFTVGSFLCSLSQTGLQLIAFRLIQALGTALLWANSGALITDAFPINERGRALGLNQASLVSGQVVGLVLGGVLTATFGWRSIFLVNVPIGIFATIWAHYKLREITVPKKKQKLDIWGNLTFAGGLSILLLGVTLGALETWNAFHFAMIGLGGIMLIVFTYVESKVPEPMFDLSLFKLKVFSAGNLSGMLSGLARGAFTFMMSFYLQGVLGDSAFTAGILIVPLSISVAIAGPLSGILSDRYGSFYFATAGLATTGFAFLIMHQIPAEISYALLVVPMAIMGMGWGLFGSPIRSETLSAVPAARRGIGNSVTMTTMNVGWLVSLAVSILIVSSSVPHSLVLSVFGGGSLAVSTGTPQITDVTRFMNGLHNVYGLSAILAFIAIVPLLLGFRGIDSRTERASKDITSESTSPPAEQV